MSDFDSGYVSLGDFTYRLDESGVDSGITPYRRWSRSIFADTSTIAGAPGQNLHPEMLVWNSTVFDGEGQLVLDNSDPNSGKRFYSSEGLDARVAGQLQLNRSTTLMRPTSTGASGTTTYLGKDFTDVTGTSTVSGNDRRLNALNDVVASVVSTPQQSTIQADFYLYTEAQQLTATQGSSFDLKQGTGQVSGDDFTMATEGTVVGTVDLTTLTAGVSYEVRFYSYLSTAADATRDQGAPQIRCQVIDSTNPNKLVVITGSPNLIIKATASPADSAYDHRTFFTPASGKSYQLVFFLTTVPKSYMDTGGWVLADRVSYGPAVTVNNVAQIEVYNSTGAASVVTKNLTLTATASALVGGLTYTSAAGTDYKYRVKYISGGQRPYVAQVIQTIRSTAGTALVYQPELVEIGQGGKVWLVGYDGASTGKPISWTYNFTSEAWTIGQTFTAANASSIPIAIAHTDKYEYVALNDNNVIQTTTAAHQAYVGAPGATVRGICITQNRLFVLGEDATNGVVLYLYALDAAAPPVVSSTVTVGGTLNTPTATLRQRMVGTPTGARFFVNLGSVTARIYECDSSAASPVATMLAELPDGVQATAIEHTGGLTFIAGQFLAETGQTPVSALWMIDQNRVLSRIGYFRRDNPLNAAPVWMEAYQNDLWILQGSYVWRYSLITGGLFLEYQLQPATPGNARCLAVIQGHIFVTYDEGVWIAGSVGTYAQSGPSTQGTWVSSINDFGLPQEQKLLRSIDVLTDTMASNTQIKCEYQIDQSGTWVHLGTATAGTINRFPVSTGASTVRFNTLQVRVTLASASGVSTPKLKAVTASVLTISTEDFFDLNVLCWDETSTSHTDGRQLKGSELAANLWALKNTGSLVTLTDGYGSQPNTPAKYLVKVESVDMNNPKVGEGRVAVRCRVIA